MRPSRCQAWSCFRSFLLSDLKQSFSTLSGTSGAKSLRTRDTKTSFERSPFSVEDGIWVVRFHIKYKDFGAANLPPLTPYLVIEDLGATFRHPEYSGVAVTVALSQRSLPEAPLENFEAVAKRLIKSVQFHSSPPE